MAVLLSSNNVALSNLISGDFSVKADYVQYSSCSDKVPSAAEFQWSKNCLSLDLDVPLRHLVLCAFVNLTVCINVEAICSNNIPQPNISSLYSILASASCYS